MEPCRLGMQPPLGPTQPPALRRPVKGHWQHSLAGKVTVGLASHCMAQWSI